MEQQMIWLSTSLFSNKANWHHILQDGIRPFTEGNMLVKGYTIEFNYLSGENIRLALLTEDGEKEELSKSTDAYFKSYFETANLPRLPVKFPVAGVFMPFPGNTIQYGLYPPVNITRNELDQYNLSITLSKIMVAALHDEIDDETILTFAFYLQIALVKIIYQIVGDEDTLFDIITLANDFKADDNVLANLCLMKEITGDVMQTEKFDSELGWLNTWVDDCEIALLTAYKTDANSIFNVKSIYHLRVRTVYGHLGINMRGQNMLNYFVIKSLEQYFLVNNNY